MTPGDDATPVACITCPISRAYGRSMYMRPASCKHASPRPFSAALRIHCIACRLLRVTPRPTARQTMLATSRGNEVFKKRASETWKMT